MLPLDLHVLSLSLAFILSQDQTLRCLNCFIISSLRNPFIVVQSHTSLTVSIRKINFPILVLLVELCKSLKELLSLSFLDCGCKGKDFFLTSKFFGEKFSSFFSQADLRAVGNYRLAQPTSSPTQGYLHVSIISEAPFSLESGCKSNAIKHTVQIYRALFFKFFTATDIGYIII